MSSDPSWKDKYLKELETSEAQETRWEAEKNLFQRMLVRTSLASEGQSLELDNLLAELRDHEAFRPFKDRLRDLEKRLKKTETLRQLFTEWLTDFASFLHAGLEEASDPGSRHPSQKGLLGKLFGKSGDDDQPQADLPPAAVTAGNDLSMELESPGEEEASQRLRIARRVGELLGQVLEQVSLEPASEARARRLRESLLVSDDWDELREELSGVAEQESAQTGRLGASAELDLEIQQELEAFGEKVDASQDFLGLKASVSGHLKSIREAVGRFRTKESEREKFLSEQLGTMQEKMVAMEAQAEHVKVELREQRHRAMTDVLTQLPNREAWQERLELEFQRWRRYGNPLSLAVLDIDFFKRVNDSYGHKAGDRVLQLVAKALQDRLRQTDFIARFGGEEFVVLFPETSAEVAKDVLDGLRVYIRELPFHFRGEPVSVTFSAGVAGFEPDDQGDSVFDRADKALYQAKDAGRDQVNTSTHTD